MKRFCLKLLSSSLWGCELKYIRGSYKDYCICHPPCEDVSWNNPVTVKCIIYNVILLVRMWVEISIYQSLPLYSLSSSLWGCELKCVINEEQHEIYSHPPCEDVSWNTFSFHLFIRFCSHPPCEDVSWNTSGMNRRYKLIVILLVRMWVEMSFYHALNRTLGHPPCEDVSWNVLAYTPGLYPAVIPLVRMWVEMKTLWKERNHIWSSSSWGCELKWICKAKGRNHRSYPPCEDVS